MKLFPLLLPLVAALTLGPWSKAQQRPLVSAADLEALLPHLVFQGQPVANADALALKLAPFRTNLASLSRDGRLLAYTVTDGPYTRIDIRSVDRPAEVHQVHLGDMATAEVVSLLWTSPRQLVFSTEDWVVASVDLDAETTRKLVTPRLLQARLTTRFTITRARAEDPYNSIQMDRPARVYAVDPSRPDSLLLESVVGSNVRNAIYQTLRLDVRTGEWDFLDEVRITNPAMRFLSDQNGRIRLQENRTTFPFQWRVRTLAQSGKPDQWRDLEEVLPADLAASFEAPVETLWSARSVPLGFAADPNVLYYASNLNRDTFAVRAVNLNTGQPVEFEVAAADMDLVDPADEIAPRAIGRSERFMRAEIAAMYYTDFQPGPPASPLVRDRTDQRIVGVRTESFDTGRLWLDEELAAVQAEVSTQFANRRVLLVEWDDARTRFLVRVESPGNPGRYFLYERPTDRWIEQIRRAPRLQPADLHPTTAFTTTSADGAPITGLLTKPRHPLLKKPPLVVLYADGPWTTAPRTYSGAVQMLAEFGCAVLQLHYPGLSGLGRDKLLGARETPDRLTARDTATALDALLADYAYDTRRVATIGVGYGAWLAVRTAQILPQRVRCVVSLNGYNDLSPFLAKPPPRELPNQRNRNLELMENSFNLMEQNQQNLEDLLQASKQSDIRNAPSDQPDDESGKPNDDFNPTDLDLFDFDQATSENDPGSDINKHYWAYRQRMNLIEQRNNEIEAVPVDPRSAFARWYFAPALERGDDLSVLTHIDDLRAEVFIGQEVLNPHVPTEPADALKDALAAARHPAEYWEIPVHAWSRPIDQRPETWLQVARFFNENLYNFGVSIGESVEVKDGEDQP